MGICTTYRPRYTEARKNSQMDKILDMGWAYKELETKLQMVENALKANVPQNYILSMLDGEEHPIKYTCYFGDLEDIADDTEEFI